MELVSASKVGHYRYSFTMSDGRVVKNSRRVAELTGINIRMIESTIRRRGIDNLVSYLNDKLADGDGSDPTMFVSFRTYKSTFAFKMDNGQEITTTQAADKLNLATTTVVNGLKSNGIEYLNDRWLLPCGTRRKDYVEPCVYDDKDSEEYNPQEFDRGTVCLRNHVECARYVECLDARLFSDNWEKPEGECYKAKEMVMPRYFSPLANIDKYRLVGW